MCRRDARTQCHHLKSVVHNGRGGWAESQSVCDAVVHIALALLFFLHYIPLAALRSPWINNSCISTRRIVPAGDVGFAIEVIIGFVCAAISILIFSGSR